MVMPIVIVLSKRSGRRPTRSTMKTATMLQALALTFVHVAGSKCSTPKERDSRAAKENEAADTGQDTGKKRAHTHQRVHRAGVIHDEADIVSR